MLLAVPLTLTTPASAGDLLHRDRTYEQYLRYEASMDKAITPARVLRWMRTSLLGLSDTGKESNIEFRLVVHANETSRQVLATFVYKF